MEDTEEVTLQQSYPLVSMSYFFSEGSDPLGHRGGLFIDNHGNFLGICIQQDTNAQNSRENDVKNVFSPK